LVWSLTWGQSLGSDGLTFHDKVEQVAVLGVTFGDDGVFGFERDLLDAVCDLGALVVVKTLEDLDGSKEVLVLVSLALCGILHDMVECVPVEFPEDAIILGNDGGSSWSVIKESELTKGFTCLVVSHLLWLGLAWKEKEAVEVTSIDNVKDFSLVALFDDFLILLDLALFHGVEHDVQLLLTKSCEHEVSG